MPEVGRGEVPIHPDLSRFGRELDRAIGPHIDRAGKSMESTFATSAKQSAASVDKAFARTKIDVPATVDTDGLAAELRREVDPIAKRHAMDVPVDGDTTKLDRSVVDAARKAARKAADELSRIPGGVDAETFERKVAAAANDAARVAAARLANIPAGVDVSKLTQEVSAGAARAAKSASVDVPVGADTSAFRRLPSEIRPHVDKAGDEMERGFTKHANGAARAITGAIGVGLAIGFGRELLELGNQTAVFRQKTKTVFEDSTDDVQRWSKENSRALGLTEARLAGVAANFGDLLKPMGFTSDEAAKMSTRVIGLAGALSAWSGGTRSVVDVSETLSKAMLGEREELKGLGISITEADVKTRLLAKGQGDLAGAALQQANAIATQELIFEKSTDAQKAWADGSFDAIKKQNELRAKVAELTASLAEGLLPVFNAAASVLERIPGPAIAAAAALGGIGLAAVGIGKTVTAFGNLSAAAAESSLAAGASTAAVGKVAGGLAKVGLAGAGLYAVAEGFKAMGLEAANTEADIKRLAIASAAELVSAFEKSAETPKSKGLMGFLRAATDGYSQVGDKIEGTRRKQEFFNNLLAQSPSEAQRLIDALAAAGIETGKYQKALDDSVKGHKAASDAKDKDAKITRDLTESTDELSERTQRARDEMDKFTATLQAAYGASQSLIGSQNSVAEAVNSLRDAAAESAVKERELADAIRTHGSASAEAKVAGEALEDARRRQLGDIDSLAQANVRLAEIQATAAGRTLTDADKYRIYRDELIKVKDTIAPGSPLRAHLEGLINQLPPPVVKSQVIIDTVQAQKALDALRGPTTFGLSLQGGLGGRLATRHDGGMADGSKPAKDEVPALLQAGEFVVQTSAVKALGVPLLERLNEFHFGGVVERERLSLATVAAPTAPANALPRFHGGGAVGAALAPQAMERMARVAEPVTTSRATTFDVGGIVVSGVKDADQAASLIPLRLRSELFLAGW